VAGAAAPWSSNLALFHAFLTEDTLGAIFVLASFILIRVGNLMQWSMISDEVNIRVAIVVPTLANILAALGTPSMTGDSRIKLRCA
jgi:hypothetical protein